MDPEDLTLLRELYLGGAGRPYENVASKTGVADAGDIIERWEKQGFIKSFQAIIDYKKVGVDLASFIQIETDVNYGAMLRHTLKNAEDWAGMELALTVYGDVDLIVRLLTRNLSELDVFASNALDRELEKLPEWLKTSLAIKRFRFWKSANGTIRSLAGNDISMCGISLKILAAFPSSGSNPTEMSGTRNSAKCFANSLNDTNDSSMDL